MDGESEQVGNDMQSKFVFLGLEEEYNEQQ